MRNVAISITCQFDDEVTDAEILGVAEDAFVQVHEPVIDCDEDGNYIKGTSYRCAIEVVVDGQLAGSHS